MISILSIIAFLGFLDTAYLLWKRYARPGEPLVCPIGEHCGEVLDSRYGRLLGFRNEFLGAAYYFTMLALLAAAGRGSVLPVSVFGNSDPLALAFLISIPAALASFVLTSIQAFVLKNWCSYCLFANVVNIVLFLGLLFR